MRQLDRRGLTEPHSAAGLSAEAGQAMDVADWLRALGFERYEAAFRENDVDAELLPSLTADDLRDLGIVSVGHRRRILEAIAALRSDGPNADDPVRFPPPPDESCREPR
jgi:SAM domain (Sterile alpha motif)